MFASLRLISPAQQQSETHALIIEDEGLLAFAIEDVWRECGFRSFDVAPSPETAIEAASRQCPTLITSDVQLGPGCRIETMMQICDVQLVPVIFITGNTSEVVDRMPGILVMTKPFSDNQLREAVAVVLT